MKGEIAFQRNVFYVLFFCEGLGVSVSKILGWEKSIKRRRGNRVKTKRVVSILGPKKKVMKGLWILQKRVFKLLEMGVVLRKGLKDR